MSQITRSEPPAKTAYGLYREDLRKDFGFQCAYCTVAEAEAQGLTFEIDHYLPREHFVELENAYFNLMYSCDVCNGYKSDLYSSEAQLAACRRFFRPDWDRRVDHFELSGLDVNARTPVGDHTIQMLFLYREALRKLRQLRFRIHEAAAIVEEGLVALHGQSVDTIRKDQRLQFKALRQRLADRDDELHSLVEETLRSARSYFLDHEPKHRADLKARGAYMGQVGQKRR